MEIKILKEALKKLPTVQERLDELRGKFNRKHAVIIAPGPTLREHSNLEENLKGRDDIAILSIKQAYDAVRTLPGFHIVNTYNFDKVNGYDYHDLDNVIIFYGLSQSFQNEQMEKLKIKPHPLDLWVPVLNPPTVPYEECMHKSGNYDKLLMLSEQPRTWWGTSIMYEQAIPLTLLLGCNKITTIGWDLTTGEHFYSNKDVGFNPNAAETERTQDAIDTTDKLYTWLQARNIDLSICSSVNKAHESIPRVKLSEI